MEKKYLVRFFLFTLFILILLCKKKNKISYIKKSEEFPLNPIIYPKFLDDFEINILLNSCSDFGDSTIINSYGKIVSNYRTSKTCFIENNNKIYDMIKKKIKDKFNIDSKIEDLQLTRYYPGEYFKEHHDYFNPSNIYENKTIEKNGQRIKTIFVYLVEPEEGGETEFPILKKKFKLNKGDALAWTNCIKKGNKYTLRKESLHSGNIVNKGIKIGMNIWILDKL
jgi:prolyl 4-hydroxylase